MSPDEVSEFSNPYSETGKLYRKVLAEKSKEIHEQTLKLASVGSPTALESAGNWLDIALTSIE
ncbi:MAG: hypothetical protein LKE54_03640 [Prevotella sp.]|jgi:hypothetical protein|nr:hypothetical protein [Prevotella sp.]MCH3994139.1 hypothetical protein [Prevotella sp.]